MEKPGIEELTAWRLRVEHVETMMLHHLPQDAMGHLGCRGHLAAREILAHFEALQTATWNEAVNACANAVAVYQSKDVQPILYDIYHLMRENAADGETTSFPKEG